MPRKKSSSRSRRQPTYRLHKARGCAVVTINGKDHYLGKFNSPESHEKYARLIAEWMANGKDLHVGSPREESGDLPVAGLLLRYMNHAEGYYKQ